MAASSLPTSMRAIKVNDNVVHIDQVSLPTLKPTYLLARVHSIAINPTDWKAIKAKRAAPGATVGCSFAGTVVVVGSDVTKTFSPGDRVAGLVHGSNFSDAQDGCFAEYCVAKADILMKIPDSLSFEDAATFGVGVGTVSQGLFQQATQLNLPPEATTPGSHLLASSAQPAARDAVPVLIHGGASATGSIGIQYAKLAGYRVLTTCSPRNDAFVRSLGADAVYDYNTPDAGARIRADTHDDLHLIWDTIGSQDSIDLCRAAITSRPRGDGSTRYGTINPVTRTIGIPGVTSVWTYTYTVIGDEFRKAGVKDGDDFWPAEPESFAFAQTVFGWTERLLHEGRLRAHPARVGPEGLKGALQGLKDLSDGKVHGEKLVYRVDETPGEAIGASMEL